MALPTSPEWEKSEWLEADGLGGFASGTVSGIRTRRYHALLLAATSPPAGRMALVNGLDAEVETAAAKMTAAEKENQILLRRTNSIVVSP